VTALKAEQSKLQTLFEVLPVGVSILDAEGRVVNANAATQRAVALEREALLTGAHLDRQYVRHDGSPMPHEEFASLRALRTRTAVHDVEVGISENGRTISWVNTSAAPLPDGGVVVVTADISTRKRTQLELERWADIFRNVSIGVAVGSPDGRTMELVNPAIAQMHGATQEELTGAPILSVIAPESRAELPAHIRRAHELGHYTFEAMHLRRDGSTFPALTSVAAVKDPTDGLVHRIVTVQDLTERKLAEEALRRSQKLEALGTLAGGVAHDFNNLLVAIRGNAKLAAAEIDVDHPVRGFLAEIDQAGKRAAGVVAQILAFARPREARRSHAFLHVVVQEALHLLRAALPARIDVETVFLANDVAVAVDAGEVHQAVVNLVGNAAHALGAQPGKVSVRIDTTVVGDTAEHVDDLPPGRYVRLTIEDDGRGMDAATLARACDPFFTTKDPGNGTGLGLSIVYGIMQSHHGALRLRSQPGRGTIATLLFPAAAEGAIQSQAGTAAVGEAPAPRQSVRALVVDDDEAVLRVMSRLLARSGLTVTAFSDPRAALERLRQDPSFVDVIITDLSMPTMSGFQVAEHARQIRPDLPVIVSSGNVRPEDEAEVARLGIDGVLLKPGTVDQLTTVLGRVLAQRRPNRGATGG
jgi:PAS domain S-box-containing protein